MTGSSSRIDPRKGCDPDILDELEALQSQVGAASGAMKRAAEEIASLRGQLDEIEKRVRSTIRETKGIDGAPIVERIISETDFEALMHAARNARHDAGCECADCWQQLEGHSRV